MKKYEFTDETKKYRGKILHRIRAVRNFNGVKKGQPGGFIESEDNLSHDGNAWICSNAEVYGSARVYGDVLVGNTGARK